IAENRVNYAVSVGNGTNDAGSTVTNGDDALEVSGRLFVSPFINDKDSVLSGLSFGVAATYGDKTAGSPANYVSNGQQTIFSWVTAAPNPTLHTGKQLRVSPQATFYAGSFGLLASYVSSRLELERAGV